jgi:hypothetical protein
MASNDIVLLDGVIATVAETAPSGLDDAGFFEFFSFDQVLKAYELTDEDLLAGQVGGGLDGGIDGMFVFADDVLLDEDYDASSARKNVVLTLHAIQARRSKRFQEAPLQKLEDTLEELLDLSKSRQALEECGLYSAQLLDRVEIFRSAIKPLAMKRPQLRVLVTYATKGDMATIPADKGVGSRAKRLRERLEAMLPGATTDVSFLGARELYELSLREPTRTLELEFQGSPLSDRGDSYIALAKLEDYYSFLTEDSSLRRHIFEGNVRDWQGGVEVNKAILESLNDAAAPQFWWLNNGVTIVCSKATMMNQRFQMDEPLIVNGLQTSMVIHNYFAEKVIADSTNNDEIDADRSRFLLVRVIVATDETVRDQVIRSTNSQTPVPPASLRATDQVQRDIESFFATKGWFYDRRKNYYRNLGKPADKIVSIPYLAQAMMAVALQQPDSARARPSSLIKDTQDYERVFDAGLDLSIYFWAAKTQRTVDVFLRGERANAEPQERSNLRFHVTMVAVLDALGHRMAKPADLLDLTDKEFSDDELAAVFTKVREALTKYRKDHALATDRIAKGSDFVKYLLDVYFPQKSATSKVVATKNN